MDLVNLVNWVVWPPNVTLLELLYTLGGIATVFHAWRWKNRADIDGQALIDAQLNGGRMLAVTINQTVGWVMMGKNAIYVVVGLAAMFTTPATQPASIVSTILGLCFLAGQMLSVFLMVRINHLYDRMTAYYVAHPRQTMAMNEREPREPREMRELREPRETPETILEERAPREPREPREPRPEMEVSGPPS